MRCTAAIVGAGDRAKLDASVLDLERLDLFGAVRGEAILQVDAGKGRRQLPQIGRRRADQARELAKAPVGRRDRLIIACDPQRQALCVVAAGLHLDRGALDGPGAAPFGPPPHRREKLAERQIALVRRPGEPLRGHTADSLPAAHIHLVAARLARGAWNLNVCHGDLHDGRGSLSPDLQPVTNKLALLKL